MLGPTTQPARMSSIRCPVLIPLYGADLPSLCAEVDGMYGCGSSAVSDFLLKFAGAEANHCCFIRHAGIFSVQRIGGRVWVNDLPVNGVIRLSEGDVISLGAVSYRLEFQAAAACLPEPDDRTLTSFMSHAIVAPLPSADRTTESRPKSAEQPAAAAQEKSLQTRFQQELAATQRLVMLRQKELAELTEIVVEREREAELRQIATDTLLSEMTFQRSKLALQLEQHAALETQREELDRREVEIAAAAAQEKSLQTRFQQELAATQQLVMLRQKELAELTEIVVEREREADAKHAEREELVSAVRDLQKALLDARQDLEDAYRVKSESRLLEQRLEQARLSFDELSQSQLLSESNLRQTRDEQVLLLATLAASVLETDELHAQLAMYSLAENSVSSGQQTTADTGSSESSDRLARELDLRAELLDRRDEELRERTRKIVLTEVDVVSQRRLLLEARQQLEQGRADIRVAMLTNTELGTSTSRGELVASSFAGQETSDRHVSLDAELAYDLDYHHSNDSSCVPSTDLRAELAGLFGLRPSTAGSFSPPAAFVDLSEPSGENQSVAFHFSSYAELLPATVSPLTVDDDAAPPREENSDDVVRDYMEQLLSRYRKSAGTVLPSELQAADNQTYLGVNSAARTLGRPLPKSPPKVISYLDQYLAASMRDLDTPVPPPMSVPNTDAADAPGYVVTDELPIRQRRQIDVLNMKENMLSFRSLSALSVENALAAHAIKVELRGFHGRFVTAALLVVITPLIGFANTYGVIDAPFLMWVMLTASIAIFFDLLRRYLAIAVHSSNPLALLFTSSWTKGRIPLSAVKMASASDGTNSDTDDLISVTNACRLTS